MRANAREYNEKFQYAVSEGGLNPFLGVFGQVCGAGVSITHTSGRVYDYKIDVCP